MNKLEVNNSQVSPTKTKYGGIIPIRYLVALLSFLGFTFNYMLRVNFNFTIVSMVNFEKVNGTDDEVSNECGFHEDGTTNSTSENEFYWDSFGQSQVIGAFFYGYMVMQVPGGRLAELFGAKLIFALSLGGMALCNLLIPVASRALDPTSFPWVTVVVRAMMGIFGGPCFPSMSAMLAQWAPVYERARLAAFIYAGAQAGTILAFPLAGVIVNQLSWEYVFYLQGGACFVWLAAWWLLVSDRPENHPWITMEERAYIEEGLETSKKVYPVPWKDIFLSMPFWAILVANFGNNWSFHLLLTELPIYMKTILGQNLSSNSLLSAMPYACMWAFSIIFGYLADLVIKKGILGTGSVRKIATVVAHGFPAFCLLGICFTACDKQLTIALFTLGVTFQGALYTGFFVNPLDIAPNYAGTILGITNGFGTIPGWLAPLMAAGFTSGEPSMAKWRNVWYVTMALLIAESLFYAIFASGDEQYWNKPIQKEEELKQDRKVV